MMNFIFWLLVGALVGGLGCRANTRCARQGWATSVVSAMAGAAIAGFVVAPALGVYLSSDSGFSFAALGVALLGAVTFLYVIARWRVPQRRQEHD